MNATWMIVAHRAGARIFERRSAPREILFISEIEHAEGRLKRGELETDRPGTSVRGPGGHAMGSKHPAHEQVAERFAAQLAEVLRTARLEHRIARLILVAEPRFLGMLKNALDHATAALIVDTIPKDYGSLSLNQVQHELLAEA